MKTAKEWGHWFTEHRYLCISLIRIYLGVGLFMKGVSFVVNQEALGALLIEHDIPMGGSGLLHFIILAHIAGGLMMTFGFATRVGAALQIPIVFGALVMVHWAGGLFSFGEESRFTALVLFLLVMFVWHGGGPLSFDEHLARRDAERHSRLRGGALDNVV